MKKNQNAITLISLIITIIILLILAGVVINLALGNNDMLKLASDASKNYIDAQDKEILDLEKLYSQIKIATNDGSKITISYEDLNKIINDKVKEKSGVLLWSNNDTSSAFAPQTITLSRPLSDFKYIKILYLFNISSDAPSYSGEAIIMNNKVSSSLFCSVYLSGYAGHPLYYRTYTGENNTLTFNYGHSSGSGSDNTVNNEVCMPVYVIGYNF